MNKDDYQEFKRQAEIYIKGDDDMAIDPFLLEDALRVLEEKFDRVTVSKLSHEQRKKAKENGVSYKLFDSRVNRLGWSVERAINEPPKRHRTNKYADLAEENGISRSVFFQRVSRYGWDEERAATQSVRKASKFPDTDYLTKSEWEEIADEISQF